MDVRVESPFPFAALPRVWGWIQKFRHKVADDFSPKTLDEFVSLEASRWERQKTWAIYGDGELGGLVIFERVSPWRGEAHVLLKPDFQGKGVAMKACRQAVSEMFAHGVGKLSFSVLEKNLAVGSLICNLGGRREGCLRSETVQGGHPTDVWVYGLTKADFEGKHELSIRKDNDHEQQQHPDDDRARLATVQPTA